MKFTPLYKNGPVILNAEKHTDDRGFFARSFCENELATADLPTNWPQSNISFNHKKGTVRGMHFQMPHAPEPKIVRCTRGAIYDVVIDLRASSPQFCKAFAVKLNADNHDALYIPHGFAHGFQTLRDDTEILYLMGGVYTPDAQRGVRWDDPAFDVQWPMDITVISPRDMAYNDFNPAEDMFS